VYSIETMSVRRAMTEVAASLLLVIITACAAQGVPHDDGRLARLFADSQYQAQPQHNGRKSVHGGRTTEVSRNAGGGGHLDRGC
jgi:hypothetical protein